MKPENEFWEFDKNPSATSKASRLFFFAEFHGGGGGIDEKTLVYNIPIKQIFYLKHNSCPFKTIKLFLKKNL